MENHANCSKVLPTSEIFRRGTPDNGLDGEGGGHRRKGYFFWIYVYEKVGISLVGAYEKLGKAVISSVKRPKMANKCILWL